MTAAERAGEHLPPWLARLSPECRDAVRRNVAQAPPLADEQVERLAALLRTGGGAR